jgi:hypothetical protein
MIHTCLLYLYVTYTYSKQVWILMASPGISRLHWLISVRHAVLPDLNDIGDTRFALLTSLPICSLLPRKEFLRGTRISSIATRAKTTESETIRLQPATEDTYQHVAM